MNKLGFRLLWSFWMLGAGVCVLVSIFPLKMHSQPQEKDMSLMSLIPRNNLQGWAASREPELYSGEDLFLYINGGAEIYHEYGFRRLAVQEFRTKTGRSINLEIFEMENPAAAFGIYTFKVSQEGRELSTGDQGRLEDYYLNVRKGRFLLTLTGFDEDEATIQGLIALAEKVDSRIQVKAYRRPEIAALLPSEGLDADSIKYFKGTLGLFNSHRFFTDRAVFLREGVRGDYSDGYSVFILSYDSKSEAMTHWNSLTEGFREDPRYTNLKSPGGSEIKARQSGEIGLHAFRQTKYIIIVLGDRQAVEKMQLKIRWALFLN